MKLLSNHLYQFRSKLWNEKRVSQWCRLRYLKRTYCGVIRGYWSSLVGRVIYVGKYRPLILGRNVDFDLGPGSVIVMEGETKTSQISSPSNPFFPTATSVGVFPHWDHMNPPMSRPTRLRLKKNARLILAPNTTILVGGYLAIWPDQELKIGEDSYIAHGVSINTRCGLEIGRNVMIGHESTIMDYDGHPVYCLSDGINNKNDTYAGASKKIRIEDNVWIGFKATILKGVTIGAGAIVGANSCVTSDVPENSIVAGNPARVIKENVTWRKY